MNDDIRELIKELQQQLTKIFVITIVAISAVCIVACMSMAYSITKVSKEYFDYQYTPPSITNTQTQTNN